MRQFLLAGMNAVVVKLEGGRRSIVARRRRLRSKVKGKPKCFLQYPTKPPSENEVNEEVDGRVDYHQQLTDHVKTYDLARQEVGVWEVSFGERDTLLNEFRRLADNEDDDDDDEDRRCVLVALSAEEGTRRRMRAWRT